MGMWCDVPSVAMPRTNEVEAGSRRGWRSGAPPYIQDDQMANITWVAMGHGGCSVLIGVRCRCESIPLKSLPDQELSYIATNIGSSSCSPPQSCLVSAAITVLPEQVPSEHASSFAVSGTTFAKLTNMLLSKQLQV